MLPKQHRLTKDKDFQRIFKNGRSLSSPIINIKYLKTDLAVSRFGIVVSNKVSKKATVRNKIKRQLRAIVRLHIKEIKPSFDCAVMAKPSIVGKDYKEIEKTVLGLLKKARLL